MTTFQKVWKELNYLVLISLIVAQCVVKADFLIGQFVYLFSNILSFSRCFVLKRPLADKVKDGCMLGITSGLIAMVALEELGIHLIQKGEKTMTVLELIIYLHKHAPLDGKIYIYGNDGKYHEDYSEDDIKIHIIGNETRVYLS